MTTEGNHEHSSSGILQPLMSSAFALIKHCEKLYSTHYQNDALVSDLSTLDEAAGQLHQMLDKDIQTYTPTAANSKLKHDLHNILGLIKGYSELMLEEYEDFHIDAELKQIHSACMDLLLEVDAINFSCTSEETDNEADSTYQVNTEKKISDKQRLKPDASSTILVVDDDYRNCELLSRYLKNSGHNIISFQSGKQAIQHLVENDVDVVFLDLLMPEMDGFEVLSQLKSNEKTRQIPVIIVSGIQDTEGVIRCIESGAEDYLYKPYDPTLLRARLNASLERKKWHDLEKLYLKELENSRHFIHQTFGRYVSNEVVADLLENPEGLDLGGSRRTVTMLMADIRSFTPLCESLAPERVVTLLNNFLGKMSEIIMSHNGTINEIIGDAIFAIFGAPISRHDDTDRAIACAIEMQLAMNGINIKNQGINLPEIHMGIGLNTGEVIAGNIGSELRSKYAVVGHHVNLTARVESYTLGGEILASEYTLANTKTPLEIQRSFSKKPKGVAESVGIHQITGIKGSYNKFLKG